MAQGDAEKGDDSWGGLGGFLVSAVPFGPGVFGEGGLEQGGCPQGFAGQRSKTQTGISWGGSSSA